MPAESSSTRNASRGRALLREPLLHFVALGALIFAADHLIRSRQADPRVIVVGPEVEREARAIFRNAKGREPSPAELKILRERWIDNEVLYREGLALKLEQGDPALRERVIFKALNVIESNLRLPDADDATLHGWFERHRDQYDSAARYDFSEAVTVQADDDTARRFAAALNGGEPVDVKSGLRIFRGRPRNTIVDAFGAEFAAGLDRAALREWSAIPSQAGPRVIRLEARTPGEAVAFDEVRGRVLQDWRDAKAQELRTSAVRELGRKYSVQIAGSSS